MKNLDIKIISDVSCPWCIIGYKGLEKALEELSTEVEANIEWGSFELNPTMPIEGQDVVEHLQQKYGINEQQVEQNRQAIKQRGVDVGYEFGHRGGGRIYNTFDAHRLLHWAKSQDKQTALKLALFDLYFQQSGNPSDHNQLLDAAEQVGLSRSEAKSVLQTQQYAEQVMADRQNNQQQGISSVPAVIINQKYLISGGQPADTFIQALREIAHKEA